jgi:hypothetical protein
MADSAAATTTAARRALAELIAVLPIIYFVEPSSPLRTVKTSG